MEENEQPPALTARQLQWRATYVAAAIQGMLTSGYPAESHQDWIAYAFQIADSALDEQKAAESYSFQNESETGEKKMTYSGVGPFP